MIDGYISDRDLARIRDDAYIAMDALSSVRFSDRLHPEYLKEKVETAQRCLNFMKHFYEGASK